MPHEILPHGARPIPRCVPPPGLSPSHWVNYVQDGTVSIVGWLKYGEWSGRYCWTIQWSDYPLGERDHLTDDHEYVQAARGVRAHPAVHTYSNCPRRHAAQPRPQTTKEALRCST